MNQQSEFENRDMQGARMDQVPSGSVPHLLRQLMSEVTTLFSKEVSLARAELRENVGGMKKGIIALMSGGIVLLAGVIVLLMGAAYWLATMMELWVATLIVGGAVTVLGLIMVASGKSKLSGDGLKPRRTAESLREDRQALRYAVKGGHA